MSADRSQCPARSELIAAAQADAASPDHAATISHAADCLECGAALADLRRLEEISRSLGAARLNQRDEVRIEHWISDVRRALKSSGADAPPQS